MYLAAVVLAAVFAAILFAYAAQELALRASKALKHVQLYQLVRSQFLKPYKESDGTVEPRYTNQLGNNLFQYAFARLRARYLGVRFAAGPLNQDVFHDDVDFAEKAIVRSPFEKAAPFDSIEAKADYTGCAPRPADAKRFLSLRPSAFAQDFAYYDQDAERVRGWFAPSVEKHKAEAARAEALRVDDDDTVVFHLRFAGAVEGWFADPTYHELPMTYYTDVLRRHGHCRRAILVHEPKSKDSAAEVARRLLAAAPELEIVMQCASRCEDFVVMFRARHLALSVSTFAWWAAFLSARRYKTTVFYPCHEAQSWCNPRQLKTWYNKLLPRNEPSYARVPYTTAL